MVKTEVNCKYEIVNNNTVKFKIKSYSKDATLIIDPTVIFFQPLAEAEQTTGALLQRQVLTEVFLVAVLLLAVVIQQQPVHTSLFRVALIGISV